ncbi:hypothetical protein KP509_01G067300 [Ceratopteris richardii]|uniref:AMP-dependent synthetase/ligase domain-containing protein n=1 Tax=Ceratopteris richardii TaxID=49495 RepID=A0A8T2VHD2_CERRI|nr:hypothetical protein KP509_01G067300 [Ceratopteris richardii]
MSQPHEPKAVAAISPDDLVACGLPLHEAHVFHRRLQETLREVGSAPALWRIVSKELLHPKHPHELHRFMYNSVYKDWDHERQGPPPIWFPTQEIAWTTNLGRFMEAHGRKLLGSLYYDPIESYTIMQKFSVDHPELYWPLVFNELSIHFHAQPSSIFVNPTALCPAGTWLPGAVLNAAESCLLPRPSIGKSDANNAIIVRHEGSKSIRMMTYAELRSSVSQVANAVDGLGFRKGDVFAIDMPMNINSVIIYLAVILAGYIIAPIADSFSAPEIATRIRISKAKAIFTQDVICRGGRTLTLYSRIVEANSPMAIVVPASGDSLQVILRTGDVPWEKFLASTNAMSRPWHYEAIQQPIEACTSILFSSGTSGEPKAIPYSHLQPIRLVEDAWAHLDVKAGDVMIFPTNLGWMVGPLLVYSCFLTGATLGLYNGSPLDRGFGEFVQDAGTTILGTVPSMVKSWRKSNCMESLDWSTIRLICSTGEASNVDDDLWLMAKAFYKPVIEACGGTELAAAFLHGSLLQPQALGAFSTPSMATSFVILDDHHVPYPDNQPCLGELALMPTLGESHTLLNADHNKIYYEGMPLYNGMRLRRHGDMFERTVSGFYKSHGRVDDTMNLGGIKTSAVDIERVCNKANKDVIETAAVAVPPAMGGPDQLFIFVVLAGITGTQLTAEVLKETFTKLLKAELNPYFKVGSVVIVNELPRTATNKIMRRVLRSQAINAQKLRNRL